MAWIESHQELRHHYKTKRLARELKVTVAAAVGHLHFLWWWAVDFAPDGDLTKFDDYEIADAIGYEGKDPSKAKAALIFAGFLDNNNDGTITIHDWQEYAGRTLGQREKARQRAKKSYYKEKTAAESGDQQVESARVEYLDSTHTPPKARKQTTGRETEVYAQTSHRQPVDYAPTEHNSTVHNSTVHNSTIQDSITPPLPPASGGKDAHAEPGVLERQFEEFWKAYPRKVGKEAAKKAFMKAKNVSVEVLLQAIEAQKRTEQWLRDNGRFIPNPATWLNQGRWMDEVTADTGRNAVKTAADYAGGGRPSFTELAQELARELADETEGAMI